MENRMNREELLQILSAASIEVSPNLNVAQMREIFAANRDSLQSHAENVIGVTNQDSAEQQGVTGHTNTAEQPSDNNNIAEHLSTPEENNTAERAITFATEHLGAPDDEQSDMQELANLRRRHEILRLRHEIAQMEGGPINNRTDVTPRHFHNVHFQDIEHAIIKFSGEDRSYSVIDFFRQLEQIFQQVRADGLLRFLTLRNSLTGAARLLLTRGALTYDELKENLLKEFGRTVSRQEIYQTLRARNKKPTETARRYVMEMEAIAHRSDVNEFELVAFILEGLQNRITDFALFNSAKNMNDIKEAVNMSEQRQAIRGITIRDNVNTGAAVKSIVKSTGRLVSTPPPNSDRCFNCSRMGHRRPACPYEDRPLDVCYHCWKSGHDRKSCTNPKYVQKLKNSAMVVATINAANDADFDGDVLSVETMNLRD